MADPRRSRHRSRPAGSKSALVESKDRLFDDGDPDATWVDAFVDIAERSLDAVPSRDRRDRYRTWFHHDTRTGAMTTTDGWRIPQNLARLCTCDGMAAVVHEHDGLPFSVGRSQYIVPDRTRRIVERRDRGLPCAGLRGRPVRRGPPHRPLGGRRPDRHLEPDLPVPEAPPHAPPGPARHRRQRRRPRRHRVHRRPRLSPSLSPALQHRREVFPTATAPTKRRLPAG